MTQAPTGLDVANETPVAFELFSDVYAMQASMSAEERRDTGLKQARLESLLKERGVVDNYKLRALVMSIMLRQRALELLVQQGEARGFTLPVTEAGTAKVHRDLFRCAGEESLVSIDGQPRFNHESFQRRLLSYSQPMGNA